MDSDSCWSDDDKNYVLGQVKDNLWRYLYSEASPSFKIDNLTEITGLSSEELIKLKNVHFLLSDQVGNFIDILPNFLRNLAHSTRKETIVTHGDIRGRIDWSLTYKERYGNGFNDKSLFVCRPSSKMYNLPENQLLKFMIFKIIKLCESITALNDISDEIIEKRARKYWLDIIYNRYQIAKKIYKSVYIDNIAYKTNIKPRMLNKAVKHRNRNYKVLAECYSLFNNIFNGDDQDIFRNLIENQILEPLNNDKLYEIYVLFELLSALDDSKLYLGLIKPDKRYVARYELDESSLFIYYQNTPEEFKNCSKYKELFKFYDLGVSSRRPDIIIEIKNGDYDTTFQLIEVKRSKDKGYITESVYKVLGYLNDFEECLKSNENNQTILVVWDGIKVENWNKAKEESIVILNHENIIKIGELISIENREI